MNSSIQLHFPPDWQEYELLDSGDGEKLEVFGKYTFVRPEPKALWHKTLDSSAWSKADAVYLRNSEGGGGWNYRTSIEKNWTLHWRELSFSIKPTGFKHMGVFPEQAALWDWIQKKVKQAPTPPTILNLFAYTGGSTLAAVSAGAAVTHLDSSKEVITWARENAQLSHLADKPVRWIPEDVMTFVKREVKRGKQYDAIIMDPPKFGRGTKNEVWKIEEDLPELLRLCSQLLSPTPLFFIINAYAVSLSAVILENLLSQTLKTQGGKTTSGELVSKHSKNAFLLPHSIFATWER